MPPNEGAPTLGPLVFRPLIKLKRDAQLAHQNQLNSNERRFMKFLDRLDAAEQLSVALSVYRGTYPLVLGIPRGALPMARLISQRLGGDMDAVLVRKLRYPGAPELAMGSMDASGWTYLNPDFSASINAHDLAQEKAYQLKLLQAREETYFHDREPLSPLDRTVVVVDDGLATGATMLAALHAVWVQRPKTLVCAVPVASPQALTLIKPWCDAVVCLQVATDFQAVGQFYENFDQVDDLQALNVLHGAHLHA